MGPRSPMSSPVPPPAAGGNVSSAPAAPAPTVRYGHTLTVQPSLATASLSKWFRGGLTVVNTTSLPVLVILSQLSPLHWARVEPGGAWTTATGRVWFTVSASVWTDGGEPTETGVGLRLGAVLATAALFPPAGLLAAVVSGVTSTRGAQLSGVYANGKTLFVRGGSVGTAFVLQVCTA